MGKPKAIDYATLLLLAFIWGSSFILMKKALHQGLAPLQLATLRMVMAGFALSPLLYTAVRSVKMKDLKYLIVVGLTGSGIPAVLFAIAQTHINSSLAGILNALTPLSTFLIGIALFQVSFQRNKLLGVLLGLAGALQIVFVQSSSAHVSTAGNNNLYALLVIIATFCYGISVNTVKQYCSHLSAPVITCVSMLMLFIPALSYLLLSNFAHTYTTVPSIRISLWFVAFLGFFGTALANVLYFRIAQRTSALFASSVTYMMPLVALGWGVADGEILMWWHLLAFGCIIAGIYISNK